MQDSMAMCVCEGYAKTTCRNLKDIQLYNSEQDIGDGIHYVKSTVNYGLTDGKIKKGF